MSCATRTSEQDDTDTTRLLTDEEVKNLADKFKVEIPELKVNEFITHKQFWDILSPATKELSNKIGELEIFIFDKKTMA